MNGVTSLAGASRALAAALVRAGALGAAVSLAQSFVLLGEDEREREDRAARIERHVDDVLHAVGWRVPEVCTPSTTPAFKSRWPVLVC